MQIGRHAATRFALLMVLVLGAAGAAQALPVTLQVFSNGTQVGSFDETTLGCTETSAVTASCQVGNLTLAGVTLSNVLLSLDSDPVVSAEIAVQNLFSAPQQITLLVTLPIAPAVTPSSLTGGSVAGGVTDNNGDGATLSTVAGSAFYTSLIDGVTHEMLFQDPLVVTVVNPFEGADTGPASFGLPGVTFPGPAANSSIGIRLDFNLSGNDAASFTSVFVVQPIPEPGSAMLLAIGLGSIALARRRRVA
jgi:hypothetical protein